MAMRADYIWMNGKIIPWDEAQVHVFSHALHYGSSVFEGIRVYETASGPAIFRGIEHYERLLYSCKVARIPSPYTVEEYMQATADVVRANQQRSAYLRPLVFRGYNTLGVDGRGCPVETIVASVPWGAYLGKEALEQGVDVQVSSWRRMAPDTLNALAKIGGQYVNSQNIVMEAKDNGFSEGIALDINGYVSEGSGENIFLVLKGQIFTPPLSNSILGGITRQCAMTIAEELGYTVKEATLPARCSTWPTRSSSLAPRPRSRQCVPSIVCRWVRANAVPSPKRSRRSSLASSKVSWPIRMVGLRR